MVSISSEKIFFIYGESWSADLFGIHSSVCLIPLVHMQLWGSGQRRS